MKKALKRESEADVEARLREKVRTELQGIAYKWVCPGRNGVPDRMVCLPGGHVIFVELKAPGKQLRYNQIIRRKELLRLGFRVVMLDSKAAVDTFIEGLRGAQP